MNKELYFKILDKVALGVGIISIILILAGSYNKKIMRYDTLRVSDRTMNKKIIELEEKIKELERQK